jgi:ABC-type bacteriocin/lantibiotic exporter with double-glycine peptidase domain
VQSWFGKRSSRNSFARALPLRAFKLKFGLKFLLGAMQSVGVLLLLFAGGIMVLKEKTEIGIVVAFISGLIASSILGAS